MDTTDKSSSLWEETGTIEWTTCKFKNGCVYEEPQEHYDANLKTEQLSFDRIHSHVLARCLLSRRLSACTLLSVPW
jgi:hypothetical protein